jgi:glutamate/tyrosine decarboxylase-like PLP-dependent enzyme
MKERILSLQALSEKMNPSGADYENLNSAAGEFANSFLSSLDQGQAYRQIPSMKGKLENADQTAAFGEILDQLREDMLQVGLNPASGGHLGYIPGGGLYAGVLGDYLAALTNQYAGIFYGGPGAVKIENELIRWLCQLMDYPDTSLGNLTSGGSIANLIAFVTAREARGLKAAEFENQCIYLTAQVHHCVHKAIRICGMQEAKIRTVAMDERFRMDATDLEQQIKQDHKAGLRPFLVVASAGTTDTGAVDPMDRIADLAQSHGLWFHVDAAYGGFFKMVDLEQGESGYTRDLFKGIERSDSLAIDPHKGMFLSYGLGAVLIKDVASQYKAHYYRAAYMQDTLSNQEELSPCDLSPELTKHFRGLRMWLPLRLYGLDVFKAAWEEKILLCRYFYEEIKKMGFETGPFPDLSVCIYRYLSEQGDPDAFNRALVEYVVRDGRVFVSSTTIEGVFWIRIAILSFRTHLSTIDLYLEILREGLYHLLKPTRPV